MIRSVGASTCVCLLLLTATSLGQAPAAPPAKVSPDSVVPGELVIDPPTLINLGFEWFIQGDPNRNATVDVAFRSDDNGTVQGLVGAGFGAALVPLLTVDRNDARVSVLEIEPEIPHRRIALAWHRDRHRSPAARAAIAWPKPMHIQAIP